MQLIIPDEKNERKYRIHDAREFRYQINCNIVRIIEKAVISLLGR